MWLNFYKIKIQIKYYNYTICIMFVIVSRYMTSHLLIRCLVANYKICLNIIKKFLYRCELQLGVVGSIAEEKHIGSSCNEGVLWSSLYQPSKWNCSNYSTIHFCWSRMFHTKFTFIKILTISIHFSWIVLNYLIFYGLSSFVLSFFINYLCVQFIVLKVNN